MTASFGPAERARRLDEHDRLLRDRQVRFRGVVGVVEADRDELADPRDRHAEARRAVDERQFRIGIGRIFSSGERDRLSGVMSAMTSDRSRSLP